MDTQLLTTKLYIPPIRPDLVPRPRLIQRLDEGLRVGHRLTLVSALAGFGKTTLLSEWAVGCGRPIAWLSLDEGDNVDGEVQIDPLQANNAWRRMSRFDPEAAGMPSRCATPCPRLNHR